MPRPTTFNADVAARIVGARLVGASLRRCVEAAGVSWRTFCDWLDRGRKVNAAAERGEAPSGNPLDAVLAEFAAKIDAADAQLEATLHARVMSGTVEDARLAFDVLRWRAGKAERHAKLGLLRAQRAVEEKRATGEHVDRVEVRNVNELSDAELVAEAERLKRELQH